MVNAWIQHVKAHVSPTMSYKQAMVNPRVRASYYSANGPACSRRLTACEKRSPPPKRKRKRKTKAKK